MIKIWLRTLTRYKLYTFINIAGLALGICAVVAIFVYVADELSYDRFNANVDRIYRINVTNKFSEETHWPTTAATLGEAIRNDLSSPEATARIYGRQASIQTGEAGNEQTKFREDRVWFADPEVFQVLTFNFIVGDARTALDQPNKFVISRSLAERYFKTPQEALGKDILFEERVPMVISGVFEDLPPQSSQQARAIAHFENYYSMERESIRQYLREDWIYNPIQTFVMLKPGVDPRAFEQELVGLKNRYADERVKKHSTYDLQPLTDIHLHSQFSSEQPGIRNVYILGSIGLIILLIACVNFINLANVHSLKRAREIGIRKVLGAHKSRLIIQFLVESGGLVLIAFCIGVGALYMLLPTVSTLSGKQFSVGNLMTIKILGGLIVLFLLTAFLSGTYPALFITRFNPVLVLKGLTGSPASEGYLLRRILMTAQFTISIILVVLSVVFYQQMEYMNNKPLGFQTNNIVNVTLFSDNQNSIFGGGVDGAMRARMNAFETELTKNVMIQGVTASSLPPGTGYGTRALLTTDKIKEEDNILAPTLAVDYDFIETYNMELVAGRGFSKETGTDHLQAFVINERAAKFIGWNSSEEAIGQNLFLLGKQGTVIGVVKDFHFQGLQNALEPLIMEVAAGKFNSFSINIAGGSSLNEAVDFIRSEWNKAFPEKVFEFHFLDQTLEQNYGTEQRMVNMMQTFSVLAIVISALGLFGLAAYVNHQRSKEVSIRKVLGASVSQVFVVLSSSFVKMSLIAFVIAVPFAWFLAGQWLDSFAYKTSIGLTAFAIGAVVAVLTVVITISYETIRSAHINPAETLRE